MANSDITHLTQVAGVTNADELEIQPAGSNSTKKATVQQLTQVEITARSAQDDVIEYAVGLSANGTYPTSSFNDSWFLRTSDHQAILDRSGIVEDLPSDIISALRILDYRIHDSNSIEISEVTLSSAEVKALHTDAKVLVTGTVGYVIEPISVSGFLNYNSAAYVNGPNDKLKFGHTNGVTLFEITSAFYESGADAAYKATATAGEVLAIDKDFAVFCDSAITTGNSTIKITVLYRKYAV